MSAIRLAALLFGALFASSAAEVDFKVPDPKFSVKLQIALLSVLKTFTSCPCDPAQKRDKESVYYYAYFNMAQSNVAIAFGKIASSTIDEGDKNLLRVMVTSRAEVAEGIALFPSISDESLVGILQHGDQQANVHAGLIDAIAKGVMGKIEEKNKKDSIILISSATQSKVATLFQQVGLAVVQGDVPHVEGGAKFEIFPWGGRSEDDGLPDARTHIEIQLKKFGVTIGRGGYKIVDVHKKKDLLNLSDEKIGDIRGGSDFAVVPYKTANFGINLAISVLWELKTYENTVQQTDALMHFESQGLVELLAARCISNQPGVLVVISDLVTGAVLLKIDYNEECDAFEVVEYEASLDQMGYMVAQFLSESAVPVAGFRPIEAHQNPRDMPVIKFKKTKLSQEVGLALEHFNDMVDDTEPNSRERVQLVEQLFRSMDVPYMPSIVHYSMYV
eukprot:CAMPEP_0170105750 /NCGR_PEP_ID=MMETSP0020_2-20130122/4962_1 /TAXON_ID=98059 /ORGANISM="Dinobryon sp., Strain UTEXLB2267" /LENGTH=445 /DNA_ID=CAMNT_0010329941 /DNA_START=13 /DNA_END=1350 /DNA_ORIENTATION=+